MGKPLSYAEYIVQNKTKAPTPHTDAVLKLVRSEGAGVSGLRQDQPESRSTTKPGTEVAQDCVEVQPEEVNATEETPKSDPSIGLGPKPVGSGSSIIVSPRQV